QDDVAPDARRRRLVEDLEADAVESDETFLRAEPQVAVLRLDDRVDGVLRKPLLRLPYVVHVLGGRDAGVEREGRPREERERGEEDAPAAHLVSILRPS